MKRSIAGVFLALGLASTAHAQRIEIRLRPDRPAAKPSAGAEADLAQVSRLLVEKTNALRRHAGRSQLLVNRELSQAAGDFSRFMADGDKYGHTADGREPAERVVASGYEYCLIDENIAWLFSSSGFTTAELAAKFFELWEQSPEHRQNLLDPDLLEIGVGMAQSTKTGRYYGVQDFGRPLSARIEFDVFNSTGTLLHYRIDGEPFALEPRYGRRHMRPRPPLLELAGPDRTSTPLFTAHPATGDRYIARGAAQGGIAVERAQGKQGAAPAAVQKPHE